MNSFNNPTGNMSEPFPMFTFAENKTKEKAVCRLMVEIQKGWDSAEKDGWVSEEEAYHLLAIEE